jgi:hypothetical protein
MVRFEAGKAFLRNGVWTCADRELERTLNEATRSWISSTGGPRYDHPDQELAVAQEMGSRFNGRTALHVRSNGGGRAAFERHRQLEFEFTAFIPGNSRAQRAK